jgi:DNA modification methylase
MLRGLPDKSVDLFFTDPPYSPVAFMQARERRRPARNTSAT